MRITSLQVPCFKNLKNLTVEPEDYTAQVIIGQNASGKSNFIEALVAIFRHLDLADEIPPFDYQLEYTCRGHTVSIRAEDSDVTIKVRDQGEEVVKYIKIDEFSRQALKYLPAQVFAYYSGRTQPLCTESAEWLSKLHRIQEELSTLLGNRYIDLVTPKFLNHRIRDRILSEAEVYYDSEG